MLELIDGNVNLIIPEKQLTLLQENIKELSSEAAVTCVLLIDSAGKIITSSGKMKHLDLTIIAALASGDYATTRELAKRVGEREFSLVFQRENQLNAYLSAVGEDALVVVLFEKEATLGLIRIRVKATQRRIKAVLAQCERKVEGPENLRASFQVRALGERSEPLDGESPRGAKRAASDESPRGAKRAASDESPAISSMASTVKTTPELKVPLKLARWFWRIKKLVDNCLLIKVQERHPEKWKAVGEKISKLAALRKAGDFEECEDLSAEVEEDLMRILKAAIGLGDPIQKEDLVWEKIEFFHSLVKETTGIYEQRLDEAQTRIMLDHVDKDSCHRYPSFFSDSSLGQVSKAALGSLRFYDAEESGQTVASAFLDLLLSRVWVIRKIFGAEVERKLLGQWASIFKDNWDPIGKLGLQKVCWDLMDEIEKRWKTTVPKKGAFKNK